MESKFETCCQNCGTTDGELFECDQCHVISYCSELCKTTDATSHGRVCFEKEKNRKMKTSDITSYRIKTFAISFDIFLDSGYFKEKILQKVLRYFPFSAVITDFYQIPHWYIPQTQQRHLVLLTQIHKKEEDSKNIFIKDIFGYTLYVIFNFKSKFFNWSELKPNKMICIDNPILHTFDYKLVICICKATDIKVL